MSEYPDGIYTYAPTPLRVRVANGMVYQVDEKDRPEACRPLADCLRDGTLTPVDTEKEARAAQGRAVVAAADTEIAKGAAIPEDAYKK